MSGSVWARVSYVLGRSGFRSQWPIGDDHAVNPSIAETDASQSRQFDRRPTQIDTEHRAEKVDLDTFDPADRQAQIATEGDAGTRSRRRRSEHVAIVRKVLADGGRRQCVLQFRPRRQHGRHKRVGIWSGPGPIVAISPQLVAFDRGTDFGDHAIGGLAVSRGDRFRRTAEPPPVGDKPVDADGLAPGGIVIAGIARRVPLLDDDPAMHRENAAPANRPRRIDPDQRVRMSRGWRAKSRAGTLRGLPIDGTIAEQVLRRRYCDRG